MALSRIHTKSQLLCLPVKFRVWGLLLQIFLFKRTSFRCFSPACVNSSTCVWNGGVIKPFITSEDKEETTRGSRYRNLTATGDSNGSRFIWWYTVLFSVEGTLLFLEIYKDWFTKSIGFPACVRAWTSQILLCRGNIMYLVPLGKTRVPDDVVGRQQSIPQHWSTAWACSSDPKKPAEVSRFWARSIFKWAIWWLFSPTLLLNVGCREKACIVDFATTWRNSLSCFRYCRIQDSMLAVPRYEAHRDLDSTFPAMRWI